MESYSQALEKSPNDASALSSVARLHFRQNNHAKAAEFFQKAVQQSPNDAALYNDLGLTLSKLGNHQGAVQTLTRALQIAPGTSRYANNLASVYFESGNPDQALQVLEKNNKPAVARFNMAYLHYSKGQMDIAKGHLTEAMKYEAQASGDSAVRRAVDRSREMMAQIGASNSNIQNIAKTTPNTTQSPNATAPSATTPKLPAGTSVASNTAKTPSVQPVAGTKPATGQIPASTASYQPGATKWAPAMASIKPPGASDTSTQSSSQPASKPVEKVAAAPKWSTTPKQGPSNWSKSSDTPSSDQATTTKPIQPSSSAPTKLPPATQPGGGMSLPEGFTFPGGK